MALFQPGWMSENEDKALKCVEKLRNPSKFAQVVEFAPLLSVRLAAIQKVKENHVLADIANNNSFERVCLAAVQNITNERTLADIAKQHALNEVSLAAIQKVTDSHILIDIAKNTSDYKLYAPAIRKVSNKDIWLNEDIQNDQDLMVKLAKSSNSIDVRCMAIEKITSPSELTWIAKNASATEVRIAVVRKVKEASLLAEIAQSDKDANVRAAAVNQMTDRAVLADIAQTDSDAGVREVAVRRIDDNAILANIAQSDSDAGVRATAVNQMTDRTVLADIVQTDSDAGVREVAVRRIDDNAILANIAQGDCDPGVRKAAAKKVRDSSILSDIAKHDSNAGVRAAAAQRVTDNAILADIVKNDTAPHVRLAAISAITDATLLLDFFHDVNSLNIDPISVLLRLLKPDVLDQPETAVLYKDILFLPKHPDSALWRHYTPTIINKLLDSIDVNARDEAGNTLLHKAAKDNLLVLCDALMAHQADRTAKNDAGQTPADLVGDEEPWLKRLVCGNTDIGPIIDEILQSDELTIPLTTSFFQIVDKSLFNLCIDAMRPSSTYPFDLRNYAKSVIEEFSAKSWRWPGVTDLEQRMNSLIHERRLPHNVIGNLLHLMVWSARDVEVSVASSCSGMGYNTYVYSYEPFRQKARRTLEDYQPYDPKYYNELRLDNKHD